MVDTLTPGVYERPGFDIEDLDWDVVPEHVGPCWDRDPSWAGPRDPNGYILPHLTLGWQVIHWIEHNLLSDDLDENDKQLPFSLTNEQRRFLLWFYAINEHGHFLYREVVLQRLKGWGKDPLAAVIAAVEFVGPCRHAGWVEFSTDPKRRAADEAWARSHGLVEGDPFARSNGRAWVQIAAVSLKQTQNTMLLFHGLFTPECIAEHTIDLGKEIINAYGGMRRIEAVTSSPSSLEGNRPTLVIKNETHHWKQNNEGIAMAEAIERNATKAKGGGARTLSITNAYHPSQESVARSEREAYNDQQAGLAFSTGTLYDSLEAPGAARLKPLLVDGAGKPLELVREVLERLTRRYLTRVLEVVRGDAKWLNIPELVNSILNPKNAPSTSRRFWYNQIVAAEDVWVNPLAVDAAISHLARDARLASDRDSRAVLEAGWIVLPDEPIVVFFDGSKSDDATALVGCRLEDGYVFTLGVWQKPRGDRGDKWLAPRGAVNTRVKEVFARFNVVAFWGDPSHAKDDEDSTRYWDGMMDQWMRTYKDRLDAMYWPVQGGKRRHAVMFDMTAPEAQKLFADAAATFVEDIESLNDIEEFEPTFEIDGHPALTEHLKNAIRNPNGNWGVTLMKEHRESAKKIDLAVCAVGARMLARFVLNAEPDEEEEKRKNGNVWGAW